MTTMFAVIGTPTSDHNCIPYVTPAATTPRAAVEAWYLTCCANLGVDPDAMPGSADHEALIDIKSELERVPVDTKVVGDNDEELIVTTIKVDDLALPPPIEPNGFCVLAMRASHGNFAEGFVPVGPFNTADEAGAWGVANIANSDFDNPHWVVAPMRRV